jgi:hypothetical protein
VNLGDLVWVLWEPEVWHKAIVLDIRPNMTGGSCIQTTRMRGCYKSYSRIVESDKQSQILIQLIDDYGVSWVDEQHVISLDAYLTLHI